MSRPSCKDSIIDAAEAVVVEAGPARMTLEAVADKAGVSKGGVLYHFPSKEALLEGMIARLIERGIHRRDETFQKLPDGPGREVKCEVLSRLIDRNADDRVSAALLAATANEPKLLGPVRDFQRKRFDALKGPRFGRLALLPLAADGLRFLEILQVSPFTRQQRKALVDAMVELADELSREDG